MKKLYILLILILQTFFASAQYFNNPNAFKINAGLSLYSNNSIFSNYFPFASKIKRHSVIQFQYERRFFSSMSFGIRVADQYFRYAEDDYTYETNKYRFNTKDLKFNLHRFHLAANFNKSYYEKDFMRLYFGLSIGCIYWKHFVNIDNSLFPYYKDKFKFCSQVTLLGLDIYFNTNMGVNFELAIGKPYYANMGFIYSI